jgi:hypothetical protein
MQRCCDSCGEPYEAKRQTSRFCSASCRVAASRGRVIELPSPNAESGSLAAAIREELEAVGRADSALGVAALALAARIDAKQDTGAGLASLSRELRATLAEATRGTVRSSVGAMRDELAARRKQA